MLSSIDFRRVYRTQHQDLPFDLIIPALEESIHYDRSAGFFSIEGLLELWPGLIGFVKNGGKIRLVTSVKLSESSIAILKSGMRLREQNVISDLLDAIDAVDVDADELDRLDLIVNLIAAGIIDIRIAYMTDALYHEKFGLITDAEGNVLYYSGSFNETLSGLRKNRENVTVLTSWKDGFEDIHAEQGYFEGLWTNNSPDVEVVSFPEACERKLLEQYRTSDSWSQALSKIEDKSEGHSGGKRLYEYQDRAVKQFIANSGNHFYQMATGTGKTFTAVQSIIALEKEVGQLFVAIVVPQTDLQEQWREELGRSGISCRLLGGLGGSGAIGAFDDAVLDYLTEDKSVVVVSVDRTFFDKIAAEYSQFQGEKLLIVDEAHTLSSGQIRSLPKAEHRLGLSATPERFSEEETRSIIEYFTRGTVQPFVYDIHEAIENGFLSRYFYHPLPVEIDEDRFAEFARISARIATLMNQDPRDEDKLNDARLERSRLLKQAPTKLDLLSSMVRSTRFTFKNSVVYCGMGQDPDSDDSIIGRTIRILSTEGSEGLKVRGFTSKTPDRVTVLREFESGYFDVLVAIKCFDQGVDVPKLDKIYIMASDASKRQTIQRRGRVLRKCAETGKTHADIYDMVLVPPSSRIGSGPAQSLLRIELSRVLEYGNVSENAKEIEDFVSELCEDNDMQREDLNEE